LAATANLLMHQPARKR